jgi:hypothetical protein
MKLLFVAFSILSISYALSEDLRPERNPWHVTKTEFDENLPENEVEFEFHFWTSHVHESKIILYSDNGKEDKIKLKGQSTFTHRTEPGKHAFMFYLNSDFLEIITDSINAPAKNRVTVSLYFKSTSKPIFVRKPVIYLYPTETTNIALNVDPTGEMIFTYPSLENGWNVSADPDGTITYNEKKYNYLFWESSQADHDNIIPQNTGTVVSGANIISYLEEQLTTFGLTSKEQADFITYWGPMMKEHENLYLYFVIGEDCDRFATLEIEPKPDNIGRIYLLWKPVQNPAVLAKLTPQVLTPIDRSGFTLIEWGGAELHEFPKTVSEL